MKIKKKKQKASKRENKKRNLPLAVTDGLVVIEVDCGRRTGRNNSIVEIQFVHDIQAFTLEIQTTNDQTLARVRASRRCVCTSDTQCGGAPSVCGRIPNIDNIRSRRRSVNVPPCEKSGIAARGGCHRVAGNAQRIRIGPSLNEDGKREEMKKEQARWQSKAERSNLCGSRVNINTSQELIIFVDTASKHRKGNRGLDRHA
jgi:hypothetical protein